MCTYPVFFPFLRPETQFLVLVRPHTDMRILLTFLMDPDARPTPKDMKLWVDVIRFVKRGARGGALSFFTYAELSASCPPSSAFR